jgi:hypothetical protein
MEISQWNTFVQLIYANKNGKIRNFSKNNFPDLEKSFG